MDLAEYKDVSDLQGRSIKVAFDALGGVKRSSKIIENDTAFEHSARVAYRVKSMPCKIVAYLHDVLEDSDMFRIHDIAEMFGGDVAEAVSYLTRSKTVPYVNYIRKILDNPIAMVVKLADLDDNLVGATGTLRDKYQMAKYMLQPW